MSAHYDQVAKAADIAAITSGGGFLTTIAATSEIVQIIAGLVAIVAGVLAGAFHIERIRALRRER